MSPGGLLSTGAGDCGGMGRSVAGGRVLWRVPAVWGGLGEGATALDELHAAARATRTSSAHRWSGWIEDTAVLRSDASTHGVPGSTPRRRRDARARTKS